MKKEDFFNTKKNIVLFGAGREGRKIYSFLKELKFSEYNICFCDNFKNGIDEFTNTMIITPTQLYNDYSDAVIIISIASPVFRLNVLNQLKSMNFLDEQIIEFPVIVDMIKDMTGGGIDWGTEEKIFDWTVHRSQIKRMLSWIDESDNTVLDIGAGEGYLGKLLRNDIKYIPTDLKKRFSDFLVYDFNNDVFPNIEVDVCVLNHVLYYVNDYVAFLEEVCEHVLCKIIIYINIVNIEYLNLDYNSSRYFTTEKYIIETLSKKGFVLKQVDKSDIGDGLIKKEIGLLFKKQQNKL